jgi:hypothetical protein
VEFWASQTGIMTHILIRLYKFLLRFYPRGFQAQYRDEMVSVFTQSITAEPGIKSGYLFLRELFDLPGSILSVYNAQGLHGGNMSKQKEYIAPVAHWEALIGTLPFLGFGITSMLSKTEQFNDPRVIFLYLAFYGLALLGLLIGWIRDFPLWSYGYIGWSLVFTWWWSLASINGAYWGLLIWFAVGLVVLIALLWKRSLVPIEKFFKDIFNDWSRLSLAMYTFIAFIYLLYDENHHPYLFVFMSASTFVIAAGAWLFLRGASLRGRIGSIFGGLVVANVISQISNNTWDAQAYYNLSQGLPTPWYMTVFRTVMILSFLIAILFWPAIIGLGQYLIDRQAGNP